MTDWFLSAGLNTKYQINILVFSRHVFHIGCEGFWQWRWHLTRLPFGTAHSSLAIGQHPWVQSFFCHISIQTNRNVNEKPPSAPPHLTFARAIGQKRASVPRRAAWGPAVWCTACLMQLQSPVWPQPLPHWKLKRSHSMLWVSEREWLNKQMNTLQVMIWAQGSCLQYLWPCPQQTNTHILLLLIKNVSEGSDLGKLMVLYDYTGRIGSRWADNVPELYLLYKCTNAELWGRPCT